MSTLDDIRARDAGWKENIANCNYESHAPLSAEGTSQIIGDRRYLIGLVEEMADALQAMVDRWEPDTTGLDRLMWENARATLAKVLP